MNYNRAAMKEEVKQSMRQTRPSPMLVTLLYLVIVSIGASLISRLMDAVFSGGASLDDLFIGIMNYGPDYLEYMLSSAPELFARLVLQAAAVSLVSSVLTTVWTSLMDAGYAGYCLDLSRGMNPPLERTFSGFSRAGSVILAYILVTVFTFLWSMLFGFAYGVVIAVLGIFLGSVPAIFVLFMLAATAGYAVGILWAVLRYAMVPFAVIDSQNPLSAMDAIRVSKNLMKGRKVSYLGLQISFIGWYLLEALIVLVGVILSVVAAAGTAASYADNIEYAFYLITTGSPDAVRLLTQLLGPALIIALVCGVGIFILNLWLTPYRTGCNARFYVYASDRQPSPYGGPSGSYGGPSGPYSGYTPVEQHPQYGTGTYSQWGAPQTPASPATGLPASPAAPEPPAPPAERSDDPEGPGTAGGNTTQRPGGPNYPQY